MVHRVQSPGPALGGSLLFSYFASLCQRHSRENAKDSELPDSFSLFSVLRESWLALVEGAEFTGWGRAGRLCEPPGPKVGVNWRRNEMGQSFTAVIATS